METFFGDVDDQLLDKYEGMFCNIDHLVILMSLIPIRDIGAIVGGDTGLSHDRSADVASDIFDDSIGGVKVRARSMHIEAV